jgi:general secretion pathway protein K
MTCARTSERGAALLIVTVAVAVLTALAATLAYDTQVSLRIAANARNELQATYLAKSGVALSRLVLAFQQQLDAAGGGAQAVQGVPSFRPQLWRMAPVDSSLTDALFGGAMRTKPEGGAVAAAALAGAQAAGSFSVATSDEASKVNFQLDTLGDSGAIVAAQVQAIWQLVCDPKWDPLFDREDANGLRVSRQDLVLYLRDWVDIDAMSSALAPSFAPIGCAVAVPQKPFESGFGDENFAYDRGDRDERYRAKNARMDSLDELYQVAGIGDAFMAAFGDAVTVYLPRDYKQNVNDLAPPRLLLDAKIMAANPADPKLGDPLFLSTLVKLVHVKTLGGFLAITPADLAGLVREAGVEVNPVVLQPGTNNPFTDTSTTYRLRATGRAGDVTKTLDVVLRTEKIQPNQPMPGRIVHWREE